MAKNVILAGVKSVTLFDPRPVEWADLASQVRKEWGQQLRQPLSRARHMCIDRCVGVPFILAGSQVRLASPCPSSTAPRTKILSPPYQQTATPKPIPLTPNTQFYLTEQQLGAPRAQSCAAQLAELNSYVPVHVLEGGVLDEGALQRWVGGECYMDNIEREIPFTHTPPPPSPSPNRTKKASIQPSLPFFPLPPATHTLLLPQLPRRLPDGPALRRAAPRQRRHARERRGFYRR